MNKLRKKLLIGLVILGLLTPIGILLPQWFNAHEAWGEWSVETIKEKIGFAPDGMQKDNKLWKAPLHNYSFGDKNSSLIKKSGNYFISGIIGMVMISAISFGLYKFMKKE